MGDGTGHPGPGRPDAPRDSILPGRRYWSILMSVIILPGVGQCLQKRWRTGLAMILAFLLLSAGMLWTLYDVAVRTIRAYLGEDPGDIPMDWTLLKPVLAWFAAVLAVYIWNIIDVSIHKPLRPS